MKNLLRVLLLVLLLNAGGGCVDELDVLNVVPIIPRIGPVNVSGQDANLVEIRFTVRDYEEDPVDVQVEYLDAQDRLHGITQAWGSHGMVGLTSSADYSGREHRILWDISDETIAEPIRLRLIPTDINGDIGQEYLSEPFTLATGLPASATYTPPPAIDAQP